MSEIDTAIATLSQAVLALETQLNGVQAEIRQVSMERNNILRDTAERYLPDFTKNTMTILREQFPDYAYRQNIINEFANNRRVMFFWYTENYWDNLDLVRTHMISYLDRANSYKNLAELAARIDKLNSFVQITEDKIRGTTAIINSLTNSLSSKAPLSSDLQKKVKSINEFKKNYSPASSYRYKPTISNPNRDFYDYYETNNYNNYNTTDNTMMWLYMIDEAIVNNSNTYVVDPGYHTNVVQPYTPNGTYISTDTSPSDNFDVRPDVSGHIDQNISTDDSLGQFS